MTSKRYQIQQKLKPLYEIRTRIGTQFRKAREANDTDTIEIWERVWKAVAAEIVALHEEAHEDLVIKSRQGKVYSLFGGKGEACIAKGNTWAESEVKEDEDNQTKTD
jgi:hypothetical protein